MELLLFNSAYNKKTFNRYLRKIQNPKHIPFLKHHSNIITSKLNILILEERMYLKCITINQCKHYLNKFPVDYRSIHIKQKLFSLNEKNELIKYQSCKNIDDYYSYIIENNNSTYINKIENLFLSKFNDFSDLIDFVYKKDSNCNKKLYALLFKDEKTRSHNNVLGNANLVDTFNAEYIKGNINLASLGKEIKSYTFKNERELELFD